MDCDIDSSFRSAVETSKISPGVIGGLVAAAAIVGMIAGVSIWKSWLVTSGAGAGGALLGATAGGASGGGGFAAGAATGGGSAQASRVATSSYGGGGGAASGSYTRLPRRLVK